MSKAGVELELDGSVWIIERDADGNVVEETELEPELVLQCVVRAIEKGLQYDLMLERAKAEDEQASRGQD